MACTPTAAVVGSDVFWEKATAVGCRKVACVATLVFLLCVCVFWCVWKCWVCVSACLVTAVCAAVWLMLSTRGESGEHGEPVVYQCLL